jgi:hypothetical protein
MRRRNASSFRVVIYSNCFGLALLAANDWQGVDWLYDSGSEKMPSTTPETNHQVGIGGRVAQATTFHRTKGFAQKRK